LPTVHKFTLVEALSGLPGATIPLQKRVKVEFQDDNGAKYTLAVEGRVSREKVLRILDLMELVEGNAGMKAPEADSSTSFGRVMKIIEEAYAGKEFSSADIARDYEEQQGEHIGLSTVSTYLSRLSERGVLKRQKFGNSWVYRTIYLQADQLPSR
jgi:hypothetical protein